MLLHISPGSILLHASLYVFFSCAALTNSPNVARERSIIIFTKNQIIISLILIKMLDGWEKTFTMGGAIMGGVLPTCTY
jgi:hypothetical protein